MLSVVFLGHRGEFKLMGELILVKDKRSWYNMLKEGATSTFEIWTKNGENSISLCHTLSSAPASAIGGVSAGA